MTRITASIVTDIPARDVTVHLEKLRMARLIEEPEGGRFQCHDLLRTHARLVALRTDAEETREAAVQRVIAYYVAAAQRMDRAIALDRLRLSDDPPPPPEGETPLPSPADALAWFEFERPNLFAVVRAAHDRELDDQVWRLGEALWLAFRGRGHWQEAMEIFALATSSAQRALNVDAEARMRSQLARAYMELEDHDRAASELAACRALMERSPNTALAASIIEWTGVLYMARGQHRAAVDSFERAHEMFTEAGSVRGAVMQRYLLGRVHLLLNEPRRALSHLEWAVTRIAPDTDQFLYGRVLWRLGEARAAQGDLDGARRALGAGAIALRRHSAPFHEADVRESLANLERVAGDERAELKQLEHALALNVEFGGTRAVAIRTRMRELAR